MSSPLMSPAFSLALLEWNGQWLLQLRPDIEGILAPGTWGPFGGHIEAGETPEQAIRRELAEEINWIPQDLNFWFELETPFGSAAIFRANLGKPPEELELLEGQDMVLATSDDLRSGLLWSPRLGKWRPLAPEVQLAVQESEHHSWVSAPAPLEPFAEYGTLALDHNWQTVTLSGLYANPVVIASDPSRNGADPAAVRIRNVDADSFEIRLQEPNYRDGRHIHESVSWMVIEAGTHQLADGTLLSAGTTTTNLLSPQGFETVAYGASFSATPTVLSQIQTFNGADWAFTRIDRITGTSFDLTMQEEEKLNSGGHVSETIGWLAIDQGTATDGDTLLQAATTADTITHIPSAVTFAQPFAAPPALIAKLSGFDGADPANLRFTGLTGIGFTAIAAEEQSLDGEMKHTSERASVLALAGSSGTLEAFAV